MNHPSVAAAAAVEQYRRTNGRFGEQPHGEAPTPDVDATRTRVERLAAELEDAETAVMVARRRQAYLAGQLLFEKVRGIAPDAAVIRFGEDWSGAVVKEVRDGDGNLVHGSGQFVGDLGELFWDEGQLVRDASDPYRDDDTAVYDPEGVDEPHRVVVPDRNGSVTDEVWPIGLVDDTGGVHMLELYASEEARRAAVIDMVANRVESDESGEEPPTDYESAVAWLAADEPGMVLLLDQV